MKKLVFAALMLIMTLSLFGETVILKDGRRITGELVGKQNETIYLQTETELLSITKTQINEIKNDADLPITNLTWKKKDFAKAELIDPVEVKVESQLIEKHTIKTVPQYKTNINYLKISTGIAFGILALDYFAQVGDISDAIESYDDLGISTKKLESQKGRKTLCGIIFSGVAIGFTASSFEKVEMQVSPTSLNLSYKF